MISAALPAKTPSAPDGVGEGALLAEQEKLSIDLMRNLADTVGLPPSVAEIYGLLFVAPEPLCLEDLVRKLSISQGSASQGVRLLCQLGALVPVERPRDRRTYYRAETRLKVLLPGFLQNQVLPRLESWPQRIEELEKAALQADGPAREITLERVQQLRNWTKKTRLLLPMILKIIGGPSA
jgi:DNA-binding transcriptional regulator GbsR (MarR family)